MKVKVKDRQSLLDIALQVAGSFISALPLAVRNNISVTDELGDGRTLEVAGVDDKKVVQRYEVDGVFPATALAGDELSILQEGIDFMGIEIDFVVS